MERVEFWEWMKTCPAVELGDKSGWFVTDDEGYNLRLFFYFETEEDEDNG